MISKLHWRKKYEASGFDSWALKCLIWFSFHFMINILFKKYKKTNKFKINFALAQMFCIKISFRNEKDERSKNILQKWNILQQIKCQSCFFQSVRRDLPEWINHNTRELGGLYNASSTYTNIVNYKFIVGLLFTMNVATISPSPSAIDHWV